MIEEVVLKQVASQNQMIADIFRNKVWDKHTEATEKLFRLGAKNLFQDPDFIKFAIDVGAFLTKSSAHIILYDKNGEKIIATDKDDVADGTSTTSYNINGGISNIFDKVFLSNFTPKSALSTAYYGKSEHSLASQAGINISGLDEGNKKSYVSSYIPIVGTIDDNFHIVAVMEIKTDITGQWYSINLLERRIFLTFIIIFLFFFGIVIYNTNYAQKIINKQYQNNKELNAAKVRAEAESTAKTEFLANVSHELRTPLNAIIGFSEIILTQPKGNFDKNKYEDYINDINNSGKHLLSIINDILDFSKVSADKLQVDNIELDLNKIASASMRFVKPKAEELGIRLEENLSKELIIIKADPKRLKQALLNLLSNSVKFTQNGGLVTLNIKKDISNEQAIIIVADNGIGISKQDIPKALASFGQIDNKLSRKFDGTGLGLPLTKRLIELMGGDFELTSEIGKGTKVIMKFKLEENFKWI